MLMAGSGKVRMSGQEKGLLKKQKQQEKQQQQQQKFGGAAGFATSGFTTSLAFTPVQGLELANPEASQAAIRVKQANERCVHRDGEARRGAGGEGGWEWRDREGRWSEVRGLTY